MIRLLLWFCQSLSHNLFVRCIPAPPPPHKPVGRQQAAGVPSLNGGHPLPTNGLEKTNLHTFDKKHISWGGMGVGILLLLL